MGNKKEYKMDKKIVGILIGIFLIGIVTGGLVDYYGRVSASISAESPVFYLSPDGNLLTNEEPLGNEIFILDNEEIIFESEALGVDNFYAAGFDVYIRVQKNGDSSSLDVEVVKVDSVGGDSNICGPEIVNVTNSGGYNEKHIFCESGSMFFDPTDKIGIKISGLGKIRVYPYGAGYPRVEVSAV